MLADVAVSMSVLAGLVTLSDAGRRWLLRGPARSSVSVYAVELVSTFQQCCCAHELKLLSESGAAPPRLALTFTYLAALVHALTFRGALCNPMGALENVYHGRITGACALRRVACQFAAAAAARYAAPLLWSAGMSELHARQSLLGPRCANPIRAPVLRASAVELACTFAVQTVITRTRTVEERYRVHAVAAVITAVNYAGGGETGAVVNPAVAFSTHFSCGDFLENIVAYWLSPLLGTVSSLLLLPVLSWKPPADHLRTKKST